MLTLHAIRSDSECCSTAEMLDLGTPTLWDRLWLCYGLPERYVLTNPPIFGKHTSMSILISLTTWHLACRAYKNTSSIKPWSKTAGMIETINYIPFGYQQGASQASVLRHSGFAASLTKACWHFSLNSSNGSSSHRLPIYCVDFTVLAVHAFFLHFRLRVYAHIRSAIEPYININ